jgi:hypothetical protein
MTSLGPGHENKSELLVIALNIGKSSFPRPSSTRQSVPEKRRICQHRHDGWRDMAALAGSGESE